MPKGAVLKVRVPADLLDRIDALGVNRSEWVREACEVRLAGSVDAKPAPIVALPVKKPVVTRVTRDFSADFPAVLAVLAEHRYSIRDLAKRLGWPEMKVERVVVEMGKAHLVMFDAGAVDAA